MYQDTWLVPVLIVQLVLDEGQTSTPMQGATSRNLLVKYAAKQGIQRRFTILKMRNFISSYSYQTHQCLDTSLAYVTGLMITFRLNQVNRAKIKVEESQPTMVLLLMRTIGVLAPKISIILTQGEDLELAVEEELVVITTNYICLVVHCYHKKLSYILAYNLFWLLEQ